MVTLTTSHTIIHATSLFTGGSYEGIIANAHLVDTDTLWGIAVVGTDPAFTDWAFPVIHAFADIVPHA
jgi:hypothetical protein